jgi:nuclear pore complex protein Nup133
MATFSPAPRRSSRVQSRIPGYSPPVVQPRRHRGAGSNRPTSSRLTTPIRNAHESRLHSIRDDVSVSQASSSGGMDIDDDNMSLIFERAIRTETVFAKSQQMAVSFYSNLPVEVKQVLKNAGLEYHFVSKSVFSECWNTDFYRESYTGDVDPVTGFALVASSQTCFVWNHAQVTCNIPQTSLHIYPYLRPLLERQLATYLLVHHLKNHLHFTLLFLTDLPASLA